MLQIDQFVEFSAAVLRSLPRDLDQTTAQSWIQDQRALADVLRKSLKPESESITIGISNTNPFTPPYEGWELVEDATSPVGTLELELSEFLKQGEDSVKGKVMRERAKKSGPMMLGERHARALFEKQERIPEAWRKFYLVFPGTVWRPVCSVLPLARRLVVLGLLLARGRGRFRPQRSHRLSPQLADLWVLGPWDSSRTACLFWSFFFSLYDF
ncbi:MAG: hypothetical protein AAB584_02540 [Patescibacteria group bacterium]